MTQQSPSIANAKHFKNRSASLDNENGNAAAAIELTAVAKDESATLSDDDLDENDDSQDLHPLVPPSGLPSKGGNKNGRVSLFRKASDPLELDNGDFDDEFMLQDEAYAHKLTRTETAQITVNIIISFVGAGLLGIPQAFSRAGWLLGSIALCAVSVVNVYAMLLLPKVRRHVAAQQAQLQQQNGDTTPVRIQSYGALGRILLGHAGEVLVNVCLVVSQTGFATAYLIFIAESLHERVHNRALICFGCVPGLALLVQARDMRHLSPFSLLANCANLLGLSAVLIQDVETLEEEHLEAVKAQHEEESNTDGVLKVSSIHALQWGGVLYAMAVTLYSMEGVGLVLSLEHSCRVKPQFPKLLATVVGCITIFMAFFGTAGYAAFGHDTKAPITLNLGQGPAASLVQGALCVALYFTYPVMMFPVWNIAEERILRVEATHTMRRVVLRSAVVLTTAMVAYAVPDFGEYLSLVGSSLCTVLGFLLPATFHLKTHGPTLGMAEYGLNWVLLVGGSLFAVVGTLQSLHNMMSAPPERWL